MPSTLALAALTALVAALVTNVLVPFVTRVAHAFEALDHPADRKQHSEPVPRLGGVAIVAGLAAAGGGALLIHWVTLSSELTRTGAVSLALATGMVFLLGLIDDVVGVSSWKKFLVEVAAASLLVNVGWTVEAVTVPGLGSVNLGFFGPVVAVLWLVGVTNAINLLDGLDGLAGGVVAIIASSLLIYAVLLGNLGTLFLMAAVVGSCLGFLRHNWEPARIFMGDSGSLTLGFLLAAMSLHSSIKAPATVAILVPLLVLGVPVIDTLLVMLMRFLARPKGPVTSRFLRMFYADRNHLHHLMLHLGASRRSVVLGIYVTVVAFSVLALVVALTQNPLLGIVLLPLELGVIAAMRRFGLRSEAQRIGREHRRELRKDLPLDDTAEIGPVAPAEPRWANGAKGRP
jgi:UDP-GlcNAc:undecaprenyl-phosphate GlcNAc-1-phosphate transferase